jgi:hypothetical protein
MIIFLISTLFFSFGGIEKLETPNEIVFYKTGALQSIVIIPQPKGDDISPIETSAGEDISTCVGSQVKMTAAKTHDPLGCALSYRWFFYSRPQGSRAGLRYAETMNPEFIPDQPGEYYITLEVTASDGRTGADTIVVVAEDCTAYPRAVINAEKTVWRPGEVQLSAAGSSCVNDEIIAYEWLLLSRPAGSSAIIGGEIEAYIVLDQIGHYHVRLTVVSQRGYRDSCDLVLRCVDGEIPPVYAYGQVLYLPGVMGRVKKLSILIELPMGTGDLTGLGVYGRRAETTRLIKTIPLQQEVGRFAEVVEDFEEVYIVGMIDEKMVMVKSCTLY